MQKDLTKVDFAKSRTDFKTEFNAMREQLFIELRKHAKAKGWVSYLIHVLCREPAFIYWN